MSENPIVRDYIWAVYGVDIDQPNSDGWTPNVDLSCEDKLQIMHRLAKAYGFDEPEITQDAYMIQMYSQAHGLVAFVTTSYSGHAGIDRVTMGGGFQPLRTIEESAQTPIEHIEYWLSQLVPQN